ncbi:peptidoglycan-binding protein [Streptomyces sp. NPDC059866]|uniref:peptidoglycan-binding protein n=1 Tax=Streptomyces sp. NPDC059866 TaxID=3346978 RepID=UPI00365D4EFC
MTSHDESEARPPGGDTSGALERLASREMASPQAGAVATAHDDAPSLATREEQAPATADGGRGGHATAEAPAAGSHRRRRPLRMSLILLAAIAVAAAAGVAATGALGGDSGDSGSAAPTAPPATTKVQRTTLTDTQTVDGNLGYGSATTVQAPAAQSGTGSATGSGQQAPDGGSDTASIVTWLPDEGRVIERGDAVYRVNEQKVPLLYGSFPLYRTLQTGTEGADVAMLEKNLRALGYDGFTIDDEYTSDTADAVREWQDDLGREETGTVSPADAVMATGARRVATQETVPGASLSGAVLSWTDTERIISVDLDVAYEDLVEEGTGATVTLPDDSTVQAEVTDIGTPTSTSADDSGAGDGGSSSGGSGDSGGEDPTLPVELTVKDPKGLGRYQAAAVEVTLKADSRKDVLAVPVDALMARQGGGYALEVVTETGTELRPVELGMFADGMVEVSGTGIEEGTVVGVPK